KPDSLVVVRRSVPVLSFFTVTCAFGITAPDGSFTKPEIEPKSDWAKATLRQTNIARADSTTRDERTLFMRFSSERICDVLKSQGDTTRLRQSPTLYFREHVSHVPVE